VEPGATLEAEELESGRDVTKRFSVRSDAVRCATTARTDLGPTVDVNVPSPTPSPTPSPRTSVRDITRAEARWRRDAIVA